MGEKVYWGVMPSVDANVGISDEERQAKKVGNVNALRGAHALNRSGCAAKNRGRAGSDAARWDQLPRDQLQRETAEREIRIQPKKRLGRHPC